MGWALRGLATVAALLSAQAGRAQTAPDPVDPPTIEVPSLDFTPTASDQKSYIKYFYFYKPGVSFEQARADIAECYQAMKPPHPMPTVLQLDDIQPGTGQRPQSSNYGPVGDLIGGFLAASMNFHGSQARFRMCMGFKDYMRYGATKDLWQQLAGGDAAHPIAVQAKVASGPQPAAAAIER